MPEDDHAYEMRPAFLSMTTIRLTALSTLAWCSLAVAQTPNDADLRFSYVEGGGGVPLSVAEAGDVHMPGILFVHGLGQSHLSFSKQLHSTLSARFHLVAFDLRGHGNSGKPWDMAAYSDGKLWAEDVAKVMRATGLKRPVIVAWSYGTLVTADYIKTYGTRGVAGIVMIGALGGLASLPAMAPASGSLERLQQITRLSASPGLEDTLQASTELVPLLTARAMPPEWTAMSETVNAMVPPFARPALMARIAAHNADLVQRIDVPMLLLAGSEDKGDPRALLRSLADSLPRHAQVEVYDGSGHSPFAEQPIRFNKDLAAFAEHALATPPSKN